MLGNDADYFARVIANEMTSGRTPLNGNFVALLLDAFKEAAPESFAVVRFILFKLPGGRIEAFGPLAIDGKEAAVARFLRAREVGERRLVVAWKDGGVEVGI